MLELNPTLWQTAIFVEAEIDFKIANRRSLVPIDLSPSKDEVAAQSGRVIMAPVGPR